ncbi:ATP-grasp domain-containing protein [Tellurirhabdus bombi]|uniref:ATP-grasp domain-containing protein n=1 Tax=Tellurirhabdus bombi TaxID=2907205 RepID=UPI001F33091D|nr:ATP-grasp domain-containing protein [Tellurirhabdus bombi]
MTNFTKSSQRLKKLLQRESYTKLKSLVITEAYCRKEKILFPKKRFSGYTILLTDKGSYRNRLTQKNFKSTNIALEFATFDTDTDFARYDMVIPITIEDLLVCHNERDVINQTLIPLPSYQAIETCHRKDLFTQALHKAGLGHFLPGKGGHYPYILKKNTGEYSSNTHIIKSSVDETTWLHMLNCPDYFKQELIAGHEEYAGHIVFKNGKVVASITIRYSYSNPVYVQGTERQISKHIVKPRYLPEFTRVLNAIGFEGLCCIDYKIKDGVPKIFEINPRFGGSLCPYFFSLLRQLQ